MGLCELETTRGLHRPRDSIAGGARTSIPTFVSVSNFILAALFACIDSVWAVESSTARNTSRHEHLYALNVRVTVTGRQCARRCLALVNAGVSRAQTRSRGSYLPQRQQKSGSLLLARPPTPDWEDNCQRPFESDVERAAQGHAEVRIAATTCHQGNRSMPDAATAD